MTNDGGYTLKVDVYSLGIILHYLFYKITPVRDKKGECEVMADCKSPPPLFVKELYLKMVEKDPNKRISIYDVYGRLESDPEFS